MRATSAAPVGIILTTYGEPQRNSFAEQWMYSYRILRGLTRKIAPIPAPLLPVIATARARGRVKLWNEHEFASPLEALHLETVSALEMQIRARLSPGGAHPIITHAYEFRRPTLTEVLGQLQERGCQSAVVVPMYIADGDFTHGVTRFAIDDAIAGQPRGSRWREPGRVSLCSLTGSPVAESQLARMVAEYCLQSMQERGLETPAQDWAILLAAHGTVVSSPEGVDNGLNHFGRILIQLKRHLSPHVGLVRVGWLNHTRGGKWTTPTVGEALQFVRNRGFEQIVYFPWGFTTDNAETALEGRVALAELDPSFERVEYLPSLNAHAPFIQLIADRIVEHLEPEPPLAAPLGTIRTASPVTQQ
jgi:protoporphyrin/coproporphyrin ferrochelatase